MRQTLRRMGMIILMLVAVALFTGCASQEYQLPDACKDGADSYILKVMGDPGTLSKGLLLVQATALKTIDNYNKTKAVQFLDEIEEFLTLTDLTYAELVPYVLDKIKVANEEIGAAVFIIGADFEQLSARLPINPCDKALILIHLSKQRLLLKFY